MDQVDNRKVRTQPQAGTTSRNLPVPYEEQLMVKLLDGQARITRVKSPKEFIDTVGMLPPNKVIAICQMGFGSVQLIGCPILCHVVCQLMVEGMDPVKETVRIHGKELCLKAGDFSRIMGLKDGGKEVDLNGDSRLELLQHVQSQLASDKGEINLKSLKKIVLERPEADPTFMIAYVLFAMATLLCPGGGDEVDNLLIHSLLDYNAISEKNWATFCLKKLFSSVRMFKSKECASITGCMIFLQLVYFETVGTSLGLVDRNLTPLFGWGVDQAKRLVCWVDHLGGFVDGNANVWGGSKPSPRPYDGHLVGANKDMCAAKSELELVKCAQNRQEQSVHLLQATVAELKLAMGAMENIVSKVMKRLRAERNAHESPRPDPKKTMPSGAHSNQMESKIGYDGRVGGNDSGDYSLKFMGRRNKNDVLPDELQVKPKARDAIANGAPSDVSQLSVSPTGPPKPSRRSNKEKKKKKSTNVSRKRKRALFKARATRIATIMKQGYAKHNTSTNCLGLTAGPFFVNPGTSSSDIDLFKFIFRQWDSKEVNTRYNKVVMASDDATNVSREDIASLGPHCLLWGGVINMFAAYLNQPNGTYWFFPTYFGDNANNYEASTGYEGWVTQTRSACRLNTLAPRISDCRRMFIPLRDPVEMGHWYLLVVHVKEKSAEIIDSAPNSMRDADRQFAARTTLNMLDRVFLTEVITAMMDMMDPVLFGTFNFVAPKKRHIQPNGYDCGVFVIRNMQRYGDDWSANYVSEEHRARLIVECIRNPRNTVEGLQGKIEEALAHDGVQDSLATSDGWHSGKTCG